MSTTGKKIIIIGATSGIGRKLAELYASMDNIVAITGRRENLLKEIQSQNNNIITVNYDVTKGENMDQLSTLASKMGGVDILIISAGGGDVSPDLAWEIDKRTVTTNVNGFVETANWAFNYFVSQGYGQLAAISSVAANRGNPTAPAYSASKAFQSIYLEGLHMKARSINRKISVTCIEPGFVNTAMAKSDKIFWLVPVEKAARQIIRAIEKRKKVAYISKRWQLIAFLLKWAPDWLLNKVIK